MILLYATREAHVQGRQQALERVQITLSLVAFVQELSIKKVVGDKTRKRLWFHHSPLMQNSKKISEHVLLQTGDVKRVSRQR